MTDAEQKLQKHREAKEALLRAGVLLTYEDEESPIQAVRSLLLLEPDQACAVLDLIKPLGGAMMIEMLESRAWVGDKKSQSDSPTCRRSECSCSPS